MSEETQTANPHPDCRCNEGYECDRCANIRIANSRTSNPRFRVVHDRTLGLTIHDTAGEFSRMTAVADDPVKMHRLCDMLNRAAEPPSASLLDHIRANQELADNNLELRELLRACVNAWIMGDEISDVMLEAKAALKPPDETSDCPRCGYANGFHHDKCINAEGKSGVSAQSDVGGLSLRGEPIAAQAPADETSARRIRCGECGKYTDSCGHYVDCECFGAFYCGLCCGTGRRPVGKTVTQGEQK